MVTLGIDVSHHQSAARLPWGTIAERSRFCIARACYGSRPDLRFADHLRQARRVGMQVGAYLFYRSTERQIEQLSTFHSVLETAGYQPGDIVPALDVEADPGVAKVSPSWEPAVREMCDALTKDYGGVILYITAREWQMLGMPTWCLSLPLWTAHYREGKPLTPGDVPCLIHQHRVGPYDPDGPGGMFKGALVIDQNRAFGPLPVAARVPWMKSNTPVVHSPTLKDVATAAQAHRFDDIGMIRINAMRELAGIDPDDGGADEP